MFNPLSRRARRVTLLLVSLLVAITATAQQPPRYDTPLLTDPRTAPFDPRMAGARLWRTWAHIQPRQWIFTSPGPPQPGQPHNVPNASIVAIVGVRNVDPLDSSAYDVRFYSQCKREVVLPWSVVDALPQFVAKGTGQSSWRALELIEVVGGKVARRFASFKTFERTGVSAVFRVELWPCDARPENVTYAFVFGADK